MVQPAVGALPSRVVDVDGGRPESASRLVSLAEAKGVLRDVLAAVRNLEHLLRSPRVGPRALGQVIPGLKGLCDPLSAAVEQILEHVAASNATSARPIAIDAALTSLRGYVPEVCDRLRTALDKVAGVALDAKSRLSFEAAIVRAGAELNSVRQLLDLLVRAVEGSHTELFIEELLQATFSPTVSNRAGQASREGDRVLRGRCERFSGEPPGLDAAHYAGAISAARASTGDRVSLSATCRQGRAGGLRDHGRSRRAGRRVPARSSDAHPAQRHLPRDRCATRVGGLRGGAGRGHRDVASPSDRLRSSGNAWAGLGRGMSSPDLQAAIEAAFADRSRLTDPAVRAAVERTIAHLDQGELRVAQKDEKGEWVTHAWVKQAILLYFAIQGMQRIEVGPFEFHDKIPLKKNLHEAGVRVVPPGVVRYGAFLETGAIVMPGYVNIGAHVGAGTMVDTWATVGSCAQVGKDCHLAGGVGIGGVLEPPGARPVIIEDGVFVGSRAVIVEGVLVEREAVIGAGVVLTVVDRDSRRLRARGGRVPRPRARAQRRHPGHSHQEIPGRRVRRALRAHHRQAQRVDRSARSR